MMCVHVSQSVRKNNFLSTLIDEIAIKRNLMSLTIEGNIYKLREYYQLKH